MLSVDKRPLEDGLRPGADGVHAGRWTGPVDDHT